VSDIAAFCDLRVSLDQMCGQITGDANLFSMFRAEPAGGPVPCPFKGAPFTFTYNRGSGECGSPVSRVDSCTNESQLLLRYQACPDVHGTESTGWSLMKNCFLFHVRVTTGKHTGGREGRRGRERERENRIFALSL